MPKKVGHNCFQCSKLSTAEAGTKPCWDAVRCPNRRHYQRNKARISQQRKQSRPVESNGNVLRTIAIEPPIGTAVSIIFYRERQDAPVHAIAAEVWQGTEKVLKVEPMHCMGLTPAQVVGVMTEILKACSSELGVELTKFASKMELHPSECKIVNCPLNSTKYV
jgi:hypothetical protein